MPPIEAPTMCALSMPSTSRRPMPSPAMSFTRYGASTFLPIISLPIASAMLGTPHAPKSVVSPVSRLSKRMTKKPFLASPSTSASGQMVSWAPSPMISSRAGSLLLPAVSYSTSMPLAFARATLPPLSVLQHSAQPHHGFNGSAQGVVHRGIGGARVVRNRRPGAGILDIAAELIETEAAVGATEQVDAAIVLVVLDAAQDDPRFV